MKTVGKVDVDVGQGHGKLLQTPFHKCRDLKSDKKLLTPAMLFDAFLLIKKVFLQQGPMTIHSQSSCHHYATDSEKKTQDKTRNRCSYRLSRNQKSRGEKTADNP